MMMGLQVLGILESALGFALGTSLASLKHGLPPRPSWQGHTLFIPYFRVF